MTDRNQTTEEIEAVIDYAESTSQVLEIISGEGVLGNIEVYTGKQSVRAIKCRLTRERCNGDRWARLDTSDGVSLLAYC